MGLKKGVREGGAFFQKGEFREDKIRKEKTKKNLSSSALRKKGGAVFLKRGKRPGESRGKMWTRVRKNLGKKRVVFEEQGGGREGRGGSGEIGPR